MHTLTTDTYEVTSTEHLRFMPRLFSTDFIRAEACMYLYAGRYLTGDYGGEGTFVRLSGTGCYLVPQEGIWRFENPENGSVEHVTADAAGIIITAMVLSHRSHFYDRHDREELYRHFTLRHSQLMDFAKTHPEAAAISRALK